ncbi:MAG: tRNA uridine(34) 5-carboxymethylaminomethyl modification radical SAM/GNAT enzyme Elp3 [Methanospirillum sp.]|uniref:tRNA uridine(34) 5-carboxymethylaminomethyl modification radical SAM/GNAT enzyme Elp3 n=1 Tax=Methanospirillum sp. TaxID=45200 RepID=UPI00236C2B70|nr:tRNA uridine(34) 5-carboxymethylaminomethyl modification radical SAM/GNAT enzyme Elp3 [Methanospirillum sp.]MDD1728015.1 tRNA uridine(34) 5-carboxymethylaminomethyl modification radical SAM/GNAT enzyme Elp3 [Methanospirillum sp.]
MDEETAYREIVSLLLTSDPADCNLRRTVATVCKKYRLKRVPRNSEIFACATSEERELLRPILLVKPSRTLSGVAPVAVMTSPAPCPHGKCLPCPGGPDHEYHSPQSYTGGEPAARRAFLHGFDPYDQTAARLSQFEQLGHHVDKAELIIMGGTITARDAEYQEWFTSSCIRAMNEYGVVPVSPRLQMHLDSGAADIPAPPISTPVPLVPGQRDIIYAGNEEARVRCVAITFETRPDWCKREHIGRMLELGVTKVELGVQHLDDRVLELNQRGCTVADAVAANTLLRDAGIKVGFHMMPNLPGSDPERDRAMFRELFSDPRFKPDFLKIYPTLITPGTGIEELQKQGGYDVYPEEELIDIVADAKAAIPEYCRLQRIQRDIPADRILAGSRHSNFRELAKHRLTEKGGVCRCIRCREIGRHSSDDDVVLQTLPYDCCGGEERFIGFVSGDSLIGFARLRLPGDTWRPETREAAFIRELHVYGRVVPIGRSGAGNDRQHRRFGTELLAEAERQAALAGFSRVAIMAGIGVRPYYRRLGYERSGPYMIRDLTPA